MHSNTVKRKTNQANQHKKYMKIMRRFIYDEKKLHCHAPKATNFFFCQDK